MDLTEDLTAKVVDAMMKEDQASKHLGIQVQKVEPGAATVTMTVREDMLNGFGICHGGMTFTLADTAFACACNSRNRKTVALTCTINFVAAAKAGDVLTATAKELSLSGRTGLYDVAVTNQTGALVAQFRGTSYGTSSTILE
jgi:acyl-CoA thioesterase